MKNLQPAMLKYMVLSLLLLCMFTHCEEVPEPKEKEIELSAISEGLKAFIGDGHASMGNVSDYFRKQYKLDFDAEVQKVQPVFLVGANRNMAARTAEIDLYNFQEILNNHGITYGSYSYDYLARLSGIFENGIYEQWEIQDMIYGMRNEILNNEVIPATEKSNLLATWDALMANYNGLVEVSYAIVNGEINTMARTQNWFRNAWRVVRSVFVSVVVGTMVGATAGGSGAIIGAIVTAVAAIADAWANDYCHFAMQCAGGWRQECSSGACAPY